MLLATVVETSEQVAQTSKRLAKIDLLSALLRQLNGDEIEVVASWLSGQIRQGRIGIGYATLREVAGVPAETPQLQVLEVDQTLQKVAAVSGAGSVQQRLELVHQLFARATAHERQFLFKLFGGELRQGALEGILLEAIAKATGVPSEQVRRAAMLNGNLALTAKAALQDGAAGLLRFDVQLMRPIQPMLAQTAEDVENALADLGEAALEFKMDGARIQVHKSGDDVAVFSRSLNDVTAAVPEVVEAVRAMPARGLILDGEVLAFQPDGRPHPFQMTMRRFGRKLNVHRMRGELPLTPYWFDLLYLDGGSLLDEQQARRFAALGDVAKASLIPHLITADAVAGEDFFRQALQRGHEGVMAKARAAAYAAGGRGQSWLKIKQARTLDLVILAAEWGSGRRRGFLSNLHLGARDIEHGGFAMLGKTFKGLTDEMLAWQTAELLKIEISRDSYTVYVEPKLVVEIAFNEIQVSPRYKSELALRFARVKRYRTDKTADEADTFQTVKQMAATTSG
jgi:DNA ligase 1